MPDLTPDQVDIISEIEETIQKLEMIARRVEKGRPIGSLMTIKSNRLNYLFGRYQMFLEVQPRRPDQKNAEDLDVEDITSETEEEWLKRIGTENTRQIAKAFKDVKNAFKNVSLESLPALRPDQKYSVHIALENDALEDDRISVDSLANLSVADALKLKPKQHKQWIAIQRARYKSQHDDF